MPSYTPIFSDDWKPPPHYDGPWWRRWMLCELLCGILIPAIVVGLLFPSILEARDKARRSQCKNNLKLGVPVASHFLRELPRDEFMKARHIDRMTFLERIEIDPEYAALWRFNLLLLERSLGEVNPADLALALDWPIDPRRVRDNRTDWWPHLPDGTLRSRGEGGIGFPLDSMPHYRLRVLNTSTVDEDVLDD